MLPLIRHQIPVDLLRNIPDDELAFFITLAHVDNMTKGVAKMLFWALNTPINKEAEAHGRFSMTLLIFLILDGVLFEHWRLLNTNFDSPFWGYIENNLPIDRSNALNDLRRRLMQRNNPFGIIRNQFAFHFPITHLRQILQTITDPLLFYGDGQTIMNDLYFFADEIWAQALQNLVGQRGVVQNELNALARDLIDLTALFGQVTDGVMNQILERHQGQIELPESENIDINAPNFTDVSLPWFTNVIDRNGSNLG